MLRRLFLLFSFSFLISISQHIPKHTHKKKRFGNIQCKLISTFLGVNIFCIMLSLTFVNVCDRFMGLLKTEWQLQSTMVGRVVASEILNSWEKGGRLGPLGL